MNRITQNNHVCPTCGAHLLVPLEPSGDTVNVHWLMWIEELKGKRLSEGHVNHALGRYERYIKKHLGNIPVGDVSTHRIKALYLVLLKTKLSTKTIKHIIGLLKSFMGWCFDEELISKVPRFPKVQVKSVMEKYWIDQITQHKIMEFIPEYAMGYFLALFETGARISEICALKRKDLVDGSIIIQRTFTDKGQIKNRKNGGEYSRGVSLDTWGILWGPNRFKLPEAFLFTNPTSGLPFDRKMVWRIWDAARKKADIKISLQQASRHSMASQKRAELDAQAKRVLSKALGHKATETAAKYYVLPERNKL